MEKTALYEYHEALGARLAPFAGWFMPLYYQGAVSEHLAVRHQAGLFDVSHMGAIRVYGPEALSCLDYLSTNALAGRTEGTATYTVWCNAEGHCIDDIIILHTEKEEYLVIVNAGNREASLKHLKLYAQDFKVIVEDHYVGYGILALQGPLSKDIIQKILPAVTSLKPMRVTSIEDSGGSLILSRTGYTGAGGFEIFAKNSQIVRLWQELLVEGKEKGLVPVGLAARDTLRLEMGFALYGHELSLSIAPTESVSAWAVKWDKGAFLGKDKLRALERETKRAQYGVKLLDPGVLRQGLPVFKENKEVGILTSGSFSPSLKSSIGIVMSSIPLAEGEKVHIPLRQRTGLAEITRLPFIDKHT